MTLEQKKVLRELLQLSIENGFGCGYPLKPIADKLGISDPLYDTNTNSGLLWEFGPHGKGYIYARGDWPDAYASMDYDSGRMIENWTYGLQPVLAGRDEVIEAGPDKGKTVAQLREEVFNPAVSDLDYFLSRCRHHGIKPANMKAQTRAEDGR